MGGLQDGDIDYRSSKIHQISSVCSVTVLGVFIFMCACMLYCTSCTDVEQRAG